jgi:tetratricopeptide (TPR) repeat protein
LGQSKSTPVWPLALVVLAAATLAAFRGVLRNGWIFYDDPVYVYENPLVRHGWSWHSAWAFLYTPHGGNWHPLTSWSHLLDAQIFGLAPAGPHAVNLALHVVNAVLVAEVLRRLTGARWRSLIVAALFALHPLRVESVAWVSERKDVLSAMFFLLSIGAYHAWTLRPSRGRWAALLVLFGLGLMAKPMLVTLPVVVLLLDVWPLGRWSGVNPRGRPLRALVREKWSLFALAAACAVATFFVQRYTGAVAPLTLIPVELRATNALVSFWRYVDRTIWPRDLAVFYPYVPPAALTVTLAGAGFAAAMVLAVLARRPWGWWTVGWLWYLVMLLPVIGIIQVGSQAWADRYSYLPTLGILVAVVWSAAALLGTSRLRRGLGIAAVVLACAALAVATSRQVARWRDTRTLFTYALKVTSPNAVAEQNVGDALLQAGDLRGAMAHLQRALQLRPGYPEAHNNLGSVLGAMGHFDAAIEHFEYALRFVSTPSLHENLGHAYADKGRVADAVREYEAALRLDPERPTARVLLAGLMLSQSRPADAERQLRQALVALPGNVAANRLLAASCIQQGRVEDAIVAYQAVLARKPDDPDALVNIAWIRATHADPAHRNGAEAVRLAERARAGAPGDGAVLSTLAAAYAEVGRYPDAVKTADAAVSAAEKDGDRDAAQRFREQRAHYLAGRPFHFEK